MVKIYALPTYGIGQTAIDELEGSLPASFRKRVLSAKNTELRLERAAAYALFAKALSDLGYRGEYTLTESSRGRPVIEDFEGSFSVSHTEGLSIVAVSDEHTVGIDTERISHDKALRMKPLEERFLKSYECSYTSLLNIAGIKLFKCDETGRILPDGKPVRLGAEEVYRWVCAEATLKCEGGGFSSLCSLGDIAAHTGIYASVAELEGGSYHIALAVKRETK